MEDSFFPSVPTSWKRTRNEIHHLQSFEINQQLKDARDSRRILAGFLSCLLRCWGGGGGEGGGEGKDSENNRHRRLSVICIMRWSPWAESEKAGGGGAGLQPLTFGDDPRLIADHRPLIELFTWCSTVVAPGHHIPPILQDSSGFFRILWDSLGFFGILQLQLKQNGGK